MGYQELIESLRAEGEDKIRKLWNSAEAEGEKIKEDTSVKVERLRSEFSKKKEKMEQEIRGDILSEANKKAREIRLSSETELAGRFLPVAMSCLSTLRNEKYVDSFVSLVRELPRVTWKEARVNTEDMNLAKEFLKGVKVTTDDSISGGLEVVSEEKRMRIINTFEKRLERAWEKLLSDLMKDACEGLDT